MALSFRDALRQIKETADIVSIVGRTVELKKAGSDSFKGLCPFHGEKTPSFTVRPSRGTFHCFGCGAGGSVIDFVMRQERLEMPEAVRQLAKEMGIELIEEQVSPQVRAARDAEEAQRRALQSVTEFAQKLFRRNLVQGRNAEASGLVERRGMAGAMAEAFELGATVDEWSQLRDEALRAGFSDDLLQQAGLTIHNVERNSRYDRFRNRLMFPIFDHLSRLVGFGGRALVDEPGSPKYLNSPESPLYQKSKLLYGLNLAHKPITDKGHAILSEGYVDVISAHAAGFPETVAVLGTAVSADQARLLRRYAGRVYFAYDGDRAGREKMASSGSILLASGLDVRIVEFPDGEDLDSFLKKNGREALVALMGKAREYLDYVVDWHAQDLELETMAGKLSLVERMAPVLASVQNDIARELAINRLLGKLGSLPREAIYRVLDSARRREERRAAGIEQAPAEGAPSKYDPLDWYVLKVLLESYEALQIFRQELNESWLRDPKLDSWIMYFVYGEGDTRRILEEAEEREDDPAPREVIHAALVDQRLVGEPVHAAHQLIARLKRRHFMSVSEQLIRSLENYRDDVPEKLLLLIYEECLRAFRTEIPCASVQMA